MSLDGHDFAAINQDALPITQVALQGLHCHSSHSFTVDGGLHISLVVVIVALEKREEVRRLITEGFHWQELLLLIDSRCPSLVG